MKARAAMTRLRLLRLALALVSVIWLGGCTALVVTGAVVGTAAATVGAVVTTGAGAIGSAARGVAGVFSDDDD
jgi:hypothetical protein